MKDIYVRPKASE